MSIPISSIGRVHERSECLIAVPTEVVRDSCDFSEGIELFEVLDDGTATIAFIDSGHQYQPIA